ncbi:MAG: GntR family transcriptional regulator [Hyphomicrobiaceae bacterium]|nr:GntR family transcriptional regulator [Hyphomicrobiaceae bacterium]
MLTRRLSRRALYQQVRDVLASRIAAGEWRPGVALPSEADLARELGVSSGTTRKALKLLEAERLLTRRQGHGTFVTDPASDEHALRYTNICTGDGERIASEVEVLEVSKGLASEAQRNRLGLRPDGETCCIRRVHRCDGEPFIVEEIAMPSVLFPGLVERGDLSRSIASLAREFGILLGRAEERLSVGAATEFGAKLLRLPVGAPILMLDRLIHSVDGTPVEWCLRQAHLDDKYYDAKLD